MTNEMQWETGLVESFTNLISTRLGLNLQAQDRAELCAKLVRRMQAQQIAHPGLYYSLLSQNTPYSQQEWQELILLLTNVESYFFRDQGQFSLLRYRLLPELIQRNRPQKRLRIWSAGCSTGEEPYSLAIVLAELIPDLEQWDCQILGTDINAWALKQAREGIYPPWSLRGMGDRERAQYFRPLGQHYQLSPHLKRIVEFQWFNLASRTPAPVTAIDLILCRNVFIYFSKSAIANAVQMFTEALRPPGYLVTGHAELYNLSLTPKLRNCLFSESLVYQRTDTPIALPQPVPPQPIAPPTPVRPPLVVPKPAAPPRRSTPTPSPAPMPDLAVQLRNAQDAIAAKQTDRARVLLQGILEHDRQHFEAHRHLAQLEANAGNHAIAKTLCEAALQIQPLSIAIYYLLVQIANETGHTEEAKRLLKTIIYLDPQAIAAHYELGLIYRHTGETQRAQKVHTTLRQLLRTLPPEQDLGEPLNLTVAELLSHLMPLDA